MTTEYTFYRPAKSAEDLIVEVAVMQVQLQSLEAQALLEDQNPRLTADIADLKKKIEAAGKALTIANKLKGEKGAAHRKNIMTKQAAMAKRMTALRSHSDGIEKGTVIGKGEVDKKKNDKVDAKEKKAARKKELAKQRKEAREHSKKLSAERKAKKAADKAASKK